MEDSVALVRGFYEGLQSRDPSVMQILGHDIVWTTPHTLPWGLQGSDGTYHGLEEVLRYFQACTTKVRGLHVRVDECLRVEGDRILVVGFERGVAVATGRRFDARCAHLWTIADGRATRVDGLVDTSAIVRAFDAGW